jgi:multiple sugar transport system substrate-binding protein
MHVTQPPQRHRRRPRRTTMVAALAALALVGGATTSCATSNGTAILAHGYTDAEAQALTTLANQWNTQHPDAKISLQFNGGNDGALDKTTAGFAAGNYPDVAYEFGSSAAQLARNPKLIDLTEKVRGQAIDWNDFYPSAREAASVHNRIVGIPALTDNLALVYNRKMFTNAGIPEPNDNWTWQDFRAAARKLTNPAAQTFGWAYVNDGSEDTVWRYLAMLWQAGGDLLTMDGSAPALTNGPAALAALQQLHDMSVTDKSVYLDQGDRNYMNLFNGGKVGMLWTGNWDLTSINDDVDYGVTYLPGYNGNHETISGPDLYMLFDHSQQTSDAAFRFTTWLTSPEVHLQFAIATGDLPLRYSESSLPDFPMYQSKYPKQQKFVDNLNNVKHVRPSIEAYGQISTTLGQMVQSVLLGQAQPAPALHDATLKIADALAAAGI